MIQEKQVLLRPATEQDKRMVYEWMAHSDIALSIMGPPNFSEHPIPTWDEFCNDYKSHYFDGSKPKSGRCFIIEVNGTPVGQINYNEIDEENKKTSIDIWMSREANCGKGYGTDALQALCEYLHSIYGIDKFWVSPSARNQRAIHTYKKAGFQQANLTPQEKAEYGHFEYKDNIILIKKII